METVYQLRIVLQDSEPEIWRRFLVHGGITLGGLHRVIQCVMPWDSRHQHQFEIDGDCFGMVGPGAELEEDFELVDEEKIPLASMVKRARKRFSYVYDFGDEWRHSIVVEKIIKSAEEYEGPVCLAGAMACPPDDSGSLYGYYVKLEVLRHPEHPEYADIRQWMGGDWDPAAFDRDAINASLKALASGDAGANDGQG